MHVLSTYQVWRCYVQWFLVTYKDTHTHIRSERINALLPRLSRFRPRVCVNIRKNDRFFMFSSPIRTRADE